MKPVLSALTAALLLAGQLISPAVASPQPAFTCKENYIVRYGDSLGAIAKRCQITLADLLAANPGIDESSYIYPGQVLRIVPGARPPAYPNTYTVQSGDTLSEIADMFETTVKELLRVNPDILDPRFIYIDQVLKLPGDISGPRIALSDDTVEAGWYLQVTVYGFPPDADIDFRLAKVGSPYTLSHDGKTDQNGSAYVYFSFPYSVKVGEKYQIEVLTTELSEGVQATSPVITIVK